MPKIIFINQDKEFSIEKGTELIQAYKINPQIHLKFGCQKGLCGTCLIHVLQGQETLSRMTKQEQETLKRLKKETNDGSYRLACQCAILENVTVE